MDWLEFGLAICLLLATWFAILYLVNRINILEEEFNKLYVYVMGIEINKNIR